MENTLSSAHQETSKPATGMGTILLIDDNQETTMVQKMLLDFEGYEVFTAFSGAEALEILNSNHKPNLILLDMHMEDMTGMEFLDVLQEKYPDVLQTVPVVFLTGMDEVPQSRAVGYIRKGSNVETFLTEVRRYLALKRVDQ